MNRHKQLFGALGRRSMACLLALILVLGLVPVTSLRASAISVDEAVQKVVDWGFMRGDISGNMRPDDPITRAEFVTIINRAFGYHVMGEDPFTDVTNSDWYAQDVAIAYTENYINGTSASTFSPNGHLTREQAVVILARNMRLQAYPGEDTSFSDSRDLHEWSRGLVEQAVRYHIVNGYPDGTFRPDRAITRGEAATLLVNAIGNPVQEAGSQSLSGVYGNVTITASGVTLRDTVVAGNLYITDGVDLGSVLLENVRVLGQIVICGGGVSQDGNDSIVLRNVDAQELIIDTQRGQEVSVRVDGDGTIASTTVRTNAFLRDNTGDGQGMLQITLDGGEKAKLSLAGNIKQVTNLTPGSTMNLVSGTASSITIDEAATGSTLDIAAGALADEVNLDVATTVTGQGDIGKLTVNTSGSTVTMLPDQIVVRPGDTVTIGGVTMDSNAAAEASSDPRLMGGYPNVSDLAPTSALAKFSGNKSGTVYWAVTPITAGSVGAGDLINPPSYNNNIVKSGTTSLTGSGVVASTKLDKLTSGGSYYLSAVFVDARQDQSPVKVISFSTPDDTVPAFADGYPYLSRITSMSAQVTVMPTKTCQLYYALLPKGASAPTEDNFKAGSGAIPGNLGYGSMSVTKNTTYSFDVNNQPLTELESYDLYLWLSDLEGGKSSAVKKLSFTTVDGTPPVFNTEPTVNKIDKTSVGLYSNLNEDGTLYWVVVNQGEEYPKPLAGQSGAVDLSSDNAKLQVSSGMNALKSGKVTMTKDKDVTFTISGLEEAKAYDLYYVAQDKAGNYSATVKKLTIHTLDSETPTVTQEFTKYNGDDVNTPLPNTDIRLVFSEEVQTVDTNTPLVQLYQAVVQAGTNDKAARETMANFLRNSIKLYVDTGTGRPEVVPEATSKTNKGDDEWVIDYRYAEITLEDGKTVITFPTKTTTEESGLNLESGVEYYFEIEAGTIADTSSSKNIMGWQQLHSFKTVFAIVSLSNPNITELEGGLDGVSEDEGESDEDRRVDVSWTLSPMTTENTADSVDWDMVIWFDTSVTFELYYRNTATGAGVEQKNWKKLGTKIVTVDDNEERVGVSLTRHFLKDTNNPDFAQLNTLQENAEYQYAIHFTQVGSLTDPDTWSQRINIGVNVLAGSTNDLQTLANNLSVENFNSMVPSSVTNIGQPDDFNLIKQFSDQTPPDFASNHPTFEAGSSAVNMYLMLDRPGTVYYVVAPLGTVPTKGKDEDDKDCNFSVIEEEDKDKENGYYKLPTEGYYDPTTGSFDYKQKISSPARLDIVNASTTYGANQRIKYGSTSLGPSEIEQMVEGLEPNKEYIVYFVIRGMSNQTYSDVYAYRFATTDVGIPYIKLEAPNPDVSFTTSENAKLDYALFAPNQLPSVFKEEMKGTYLDEAFKESEVPKNEDGKTITVLDAMLTTKDQKTGESLFDYYASNDLKKQVQQIIQRSITGGGNPVATGKLETSKDVSKSVDFTNAMKSESNATNFYCLATAQNALGSEYSFKAVDNVHIPDNEPPYLVYVSRTIDKAASRPAQNKYSGTLTIQFNEPIYYMDYLSDGTNGDEDTLRPIYQVPYGDGDYISVIKAAGSPTGFSVTNWLSAPTRTFEIKFTDIGDGATFTLSNIGVISDAAMNATKGAFTLQFAVGKGGQDDFLNTAEFKVISGDYRPNA